MTVGAPTPAIGAREPMVPPATSSTSNWNQWLELTDPFCSVNGLSVRAPLALENKRRSPCDPTVGSSELARYFSFSAIEQWSAGTARLESPSGAKLQVNVSICDVLIQEAKTWRDEAHDPEVDAQRLRHRIARVFQMGRDEIFEDGVPTDFSRNLVGLIMHFGNASVKAIGTMLLGGEIGSEVASEALRWIGRIQHPFSQQARLHLLQESLQSFSPLVRDGALLGLSALHDRRAIPSLQEAIRREGIRELRADMERVLSGLGSVD